MVLESFTITFIRRGVRLLPLLFCICCFADKLQFVRVDRDIVLERLRSCPVNDLDRQERLKAYFADAGCTAQAITFEQPKHSKFGNVICTLQGSSPEKIVVGAHFDHADIGAGAIDNWSGASLLPSLYQAIASSPRKHTFVFVGFYGEEQGMLGSQEYARNLGKDGLAAIDAMVNMDTFVQGATEVWAAHDDPILEKDAFVIASAMKLPLLRLTLEHVSTDSETFRERKVPSITFSAVTQETWHLLHSKDDQVSQINQDDYYNSYQLLAAYLAYLDQAVPSRAAQSKH